MPIPQEYWLASRDFERYLGDLKSISMLATHNQCYALTRAVLHVFRAHISVPEAVQFMQVLPPVLRAIFVEDWQRDDAPTPFPDRPTLDREVVSIRADHNTSYPTAIADVAAALKQNVDAERFQATLAQLSTEARAYWTV